LGDYKGWAVFPPKETSPERMGRVLVIYILSSELDIRINRRNRKGIGRNWRRKDTKVRRTDQIVRCNSNSMEQGII